ncbi:unnamed protein product [Clonostachys rosea f. rosea IK726]|uniref:Uncharacterized protein n=1 Tax=Clonostachys rosea f. rosea IK726 TaxID=1349383 RepID=A0ACA9UEL5_BIOOC|nr:unnamed protein product [Clonostachys rosea f. rosea IK726]
MPASDEVPVDRSGDDASSYSEDGVHGNVSDAPPAEEPPADDADAGRSAGLSVQGAFDTLAAYIVGLHSLVEVCAEWSEEERAGGHPKMEARVSLIGDLETTARLLLKQVGYSTLISSQYRLVLSRHGHIAYPAATLGQAPTEGVWINLPRMAPAALPAEGMSPPAGLADPWPPADADADAGIFAGFSVDEASDTLDAYIIGLGCMLDVLTEWSREERTGGHPKMESPTWSHRGLEQTMRLLYEHCEATQLVILFSGPPDAVVESNGYRMGRLRSQIAALGLLWSRRAACFMMGSDTAPSEAQTWTTGDSRTLGTDARCNYSAGPKGSE